MVRTVHVGYEVGPIIGPNERPWPIGWENDPLVAACPHEEWESCLLRPGRLRVRIEEVVRCVRCRAPRCGSTSDPDPCLARRHHDGSHVFASMLAP